MIISFSQFVEQRRALVSASQEEPALLGGVYVGFNRSKTNKFESYVFEQDGIADKIELGRGEEEKGIGQEGDVLKTGISEQRVPKVPVLYDKYDIAFVMQFPKACRPAAMSWRFGKGLFQCAKLLKKGELEPRMDIVIEVEKVQAAYIIERRPNDVYKFKNIKHYMDKLIHRLTLPIEKGGAYGFDLSEDISKRAYSAPEQRSMANSIGRWHKVSSTNLLDKTEGGVAHNVGGRGAKSKSLILNWNQEMLPSNWSMVHGSQEVLLKTLNPDGEEDHDLPISKHSSGAIQITYKYEIVRNKTSTEKSLTEVAHCLAAGKVYSSPAIRAREDALERITQIVLEHGIVKDNPVKIDDLVSRTSHLTASVRQEIQEHVATLKAVDPESGDERAAKEIPVENIATQIIRTGKWGGSQINSLDSGTNQTYFLKTSMQITDEDCEEMGITKQQYRDIVEKFFTGEKALRSSGFENDKYFAYAYDKAAEERKQIIGKGKKETDAETPDSEDETPEIDSDEDTPEETGDVYAGTLQNKKPKNNPAGHVAQTPTGSKRDSVVLKGVRSGFALMMGQSYLLQHKSDFVSSNWLLILQAFNRIKSIDGTGIVKSFVQTALQAAGGYEPLMRTSGAITDNPATMKVLLDQYNEAHKVLSTHIGHYVWEVAQIDLGHGSRAEQNSMIRAGKGRAQYDKEGQGQDGDGRIVVTDLGKKDDRADLRSSAVRKRPRAVSIDGVIAWLRDPQNAEKRIEMEIRNNKEKLEKIEQQKRKLQHAVDFGNDTREIHDELKQASLDKITALNQLKADITVQYIAQAIDDSTPEILKTLTVEKLLRGAKKEVQDALEAQKEDPKTIQGIISQPFTPEQIEEFKNILDEQKRKHGIGGTVTYGQPITSTPSTPSTPPLASRFDADLKNIEDLAKENITHNIIKISDIIKTPLFQIGLKDPKNVEKFEDMARRNPSPMMMAILARVRQMTSQTGT